MKKIRNITLSGLFLALALLLPFVTGQVPEVGSMLCPMHLPVLLCGFICGPLWGAAVGLAAPLLRSLLFSAPVFYPMAVCMAAELLTYGLVSGLLYRAVFRGSRVLRLYASLVLAMIAGRVVFGAAKVITVLAGGGAYSFGAFITGTVIEAIPGIVLQLVLIPPLVAAVERAEKP
ncbi:MAG: ECF transporter S component [Clostridia bacterium]|nr:ECF transporter S component [Clostridia bacterium]